MLLSIIPVLVASIALDGSRQILKHIVYVSVPLITISTASIPGLLKYNDVILYYYVDILACGLVFLLGLIFTVISLSKNLEIQISLKRLIQVFLIPSLLAVLGINLLDGLVNKEYQLFEKGSIGQYVIRIFVYPVVVDIILAIVETNTQKIPSAPDHMNAPSHVVYFYQVAFSIVGRYMTTISGGIMDIFIMAVSIAVKDFVLHRMGRLRCWLAYRTRSLLEKIYPSYINTTDYENFEDWFYSKEFTFFKANSINNDFTIELAGEFFMIIRPTFSSSR